MYKIETGRVYEDLHKDKELFNFSNYWKDSKYYNGANTFKKSGVPIKGFVGLKFKMCTFLAENNHESKKAKGIIKNVVDNELKWGDYKNYLLNKSYMRHKKEWNSKRKS